ncbi:MAG: hypothetical protein GF311_12105, partial [Candidatus Lokiarchaeota archaeon]|nr:hypothetical protein [Candidatus Lokiarchaeota archaeon]
MGKKYYCSKCEYYHHRGKVYENHKKYKTYPPDEEGGGTDNEDSEKNGVSIMSSTSKATQANGTGLRNINLSGGLFTENIVLRLREDPEKLEIGKIDSFLEKDSEKKPKQFKEERRELYEWCRDKWDSITTKLEDWTEDDIIQKWLIPFFSQFGYELEPFEFGKTKLDSDSPLAGFQIKYQSKGHINPYFHFVGIDEDFEVKIDTNPNKGTHHGVCQQFINRVPEVKWLFLSNGRILRLLTEYYHTYSKGYVEFDLENILANRDVKEFDAM